jgi:hypothetical protein
VSMEMKMSHKCHIRSLTFFSKCDKSLLFRQRRSRRIYHNVMIFRVRAVQATLPIFTTENFEQFFGSDLAKRDHHSLFRNSERVFPCGHTENALRAGGRGHCGVVKRLTSAHPDRAFSAHLQHHEPTSPSMLSYKGGKNAYIGVDTSN